MKKLLAWYRKKIERVVDSIEQRQIDISTGVITYIVLITLRMLVELVVSKRSVIDPLFLFHEFTHSFFYFLIIFVVVVVVINRVLGVAIKRAISVAMIGAYPLVLFPPILDYIFSNGRGYWSFYEFDGLVGLWNGFLTFFGNYPEMGITYGPRIIAFVSLIAFYNYARIKNISRLRSGILVFMLYVFFYVLGTFPSWITLALIGWQKGLMAVSSIDVAGIFLAPAQIFSHQVLRLDTALVMKLNLLYALIAVAVLFLLALRYQREKTIEFFRNARFPQIVYHLGIFFLGASLGILTIDREWALGFFSVAGFTLMMMAVIFAWIASVAVNDIFDQRIDEITNAQRPLVRGLFSESEYRGIGIMFFVASVWFAGIVSSQLAALMVAYQALAWIYSAWPLRLKRFPVVATMIASFSSVAVLFAGFILTTPVGSLTHFPFQVLVLLIIAYTVSLPIKDFKDIEGDAKDGVLTIPVVFGEERGKIILASGVALSFMLSVIFFNERRLWWWAILFGGISYGMVISMKKYRHEGRLHYRNIHAWLLAVITVYGLIAANLLLR